MILLVAGSAQDIDLKYLSLSIGHYYCNVQKVFGKILTILFELPQAPDQPLVSIGTRYDAKF